MTCDSMVSIVTDRRGVEVTVLIRIIVVVPSAHMRDCSININNVRVSL